MNIELSGYEFSSIILKLQHCKTIRIDGFIYNSNIMCWSSDFLTNFQVEELDLFYVKINTNHQEFYENLFKWISKVEEFKNSLKVLKINEIDITVKEVRKIAKQKYGLKKLYIPKYSYEE